METQIIKYAYSWNGWQPALDIFNMSATKVPVGITYLYHSTGIPIYGHNKILDSLASIALKVPNIVINAIPPSEYGRLKILIEGPVLVEVLEINNSQILPVNSYNISDILFLQGRMGKQSDKYKWSKEGAWHTFVGNCPYNYNNAAYMLQYIFREVAYKYPDRNDPRISILDASKGGSTPCPNHPVGHIHCADIDLQYYTLGESNYVQLAPSGEVYTNIWNSNNTLNNLFDIERVYYLFTRIGYYFPYSLITVDHKILDALPSLPNNKVVGDDVPSYGHKYHAHCRLGPVDMSKIKQ